MLRPGNVERSINEISFHKFELTKYYEFRRETCRIINRQKSKQTSRKCRRGLLYILS